MADEQDKRGNGGERRDADRRVGNEPGYTGPERRKGERRLYERRRT